MKKTIAIIALCTYAAAASAQSETEGTTLQEAEVRAARTTKSMDSLTYVPSEQLRQSALTGYQMLSLLAMPKLKVDEMTGSVTAIDLKGEVQLRINGIPATRADMLSLNPKNVVRVEYIDNPGVRYGDGVAYVVNIRVRRTNTGCSLGADLNNALTLCQGAK